MPRLCLGLADGSYAPKRHRSKVLKLLSMATLQARSAEKAAMAVQAKLQTQAMPIRQYLVSSPLRLPLPPRSRSHCNPHSVWITAIGTSF